MIQQNSVVFRLLRPTFSKKCNQDLQGFLSKERSVLLSPVQSRIHKTGCDFHLSRDKNRFNLHQILLNLTANPGDISTLKDQLVKMLIDSSVHSMHGHIHFDSRFIYYDAIEISAIGSEQCHSRTYLAYGQNTDNRPGILGAFMLKPGFGKSMAISQKTFVKNSQTNQWKQEYSEEPLLSPSAEWIMHYLPEPNRCHLLPNNVRISYTPFYTCLLRDLDASFLPLSNLRPSQWRCSYDNVRKKVRKLIKKELVVYNPETCAYEGKFLGGKSAFSGMNSDGIPIVKTAFGNMIIDGHHDVLSMLELGIPFVPVIVKEDLTFIGSEQRLWELMTENGWTYLYDLSNRKMDAPPKALLHDTGIPNPENPSPKCDSARHRLHQSESHYSLWFENQLALEDDPNRYFAALTAYRCQSIDSLSHPKQSPEFPLWVKVGKGTPFIEFFISDKLLEKGFQYGKDNDLEQAREILVQVKKEGLHVVKTKRHYSRISLDDLTNVESLQIPK